MEEKKHPLKNVKVVVRPSPPALKVMLIVLIVLSIAALAALRLVHNGIQEEIQELRSEAAAFEYANEQLDQRMKEPGSYDNIVSIAKEILGLVEADTILIDPQK